MKESDFKRRLVADVNALPGGYARRVEDRFAVGMLDLIIKLPALPWIFAEGKLVDGNLFMPSERQFVEGERIQRAGGGVVLIGWKSGVMYLSPWIRQADIRTCYRNLHTGDVTTLREYLTWRERCDVQA
jgi:hypothetical protein